MAETNENPLGFKTDSELLEEQYRAMRNADNVAPDQMPRLLIILANLGFAKPTVTVGTEVPNQNSLLLSDYLSRGANAAVPVSVQLSWPGVSNDGYQAVVLVNAFKSGIWEGFGATAAILNPGLPTGQLRELAFKQIPALDQAFNKALMSVATKGLEKL